MSTSTCELQTSNSTCYFKYSSDWFSISHRPKSNLIFRTACCNIVNVWMELNACDVLHVRSRFLMVNAVSNSKRKQCGRSIQMRSNTRVDWIWHPTLAVNGHNTQQDTNGFAKTICGWCNRCFLLSNSCRRWKCCSIPLVQNDRLEHTQTIPLLSLLLQSLVLRLIFLHSTTLKEGFALLFKAMFPCCWECRRRVALLVHLFRDIDDFQLMLNQRALWP